MADKLWNADIIISKMSEWNEIYGRPPVANEWLERVEMVNGHRRWPPTGAVVREFGSWSRGLRAAGFQPRREKQILKGEPAHRPPRNWTNEEILDRFREWGETHRLPPRSTDWIGLKDHPSRSTVISRFGSWNNAVREAGLVPIPAHVTRSVVERYLPIPR